MVNTGFFVFMQFFINDNTISWTTVNSKFFLDKSNEKDKYTRNRYRKYILPFLKEEDPNVHLKFLKFSKALND